MNKKLTGIAVAMSTFGIGGIAIAQQTYYQCMPCPTNYFSKPGAMGKNSCKHITSLTVSDFDDRYVSNPGSSCATGQIKQGYAYKVVLRGGDGGNAYDNKNIGGKGAYLEYNFFAHADGNFSLCAGSKGGFGEENESGGGGGAGSYLKLQLAGQDYYFVAGGGGGAAGYDTVARTESGGGGGGGIGAGGSGAAGSDDYRDRPSGAGGNVGPYSGGTKVHSRGSGWYSLYPGYSGKGLVDGKNGTGTHCGGSGGGNGGNGACRTSRPENKTSTNVYIYGLNGPLQITSKTFGGDGGIPLERRAPNGTDGTTSITSNVPATFTSSGDGYAYLYYMK